ncbi:MAG: diguanylate cyclase [Pseudomonadota bacterium]
MTSLDVPTIVLMAAISSGTMAIVLLAAQRSFPAGVDGLGWWALASLCFMVGRLLTWLRPMPLPDWLGVLGANGALFLAMGFCLAGTQIFYGRRPSWWLVHLAWIGGLAGLAWWLWIEPDMAKRIVLFSVIYLLMQGALLATIARHGEHHFSSWFFGGLVMIQVVVLGARAIGFALPSTDPNALNVTYLATGNIMSLMLAVGFMTVAIHRLQTLLEQRANLDPLTGALNRRGFTEKYLHEVARMQRDRQALAVLSIDLDFFKAINDRHGHGMGDKVLVHVTGVIRQALRATDDVARFGGEEFIVLLPRTSVELAQLVAARVQTLLREADGGVLPRCTVSIGIAGQDETGNGLDALLTRADLALYRAKAEGRDRVALASGELTSSQAPAAAAVAVSAAPG